MASFIIIIIVLGVFLFALLSTRKKKSENNSGQDSTTGNSTSLKNETNRPRGRGGYSKWIGGGLGWAFGGPIGAILGFALGSIFEGMGSGAKAYRGTPRGDFAMSLLVLAAAVMKADHKVMRSELEFVKRFFYQNFGDAEGQRLLQMLREILKQDIDVQQVSVQIGQYMDYSSRLQLIHFLFGIAASDGSYHPDEVDVVRRISGFMGLSAGDYQSIHAMFIKDPHWAYDVLEIMEQASDDEVKKAYRALAKKHHPDKVAHLGEDIRKAATEKFQKIGAAYEEIKKERGLT